MTLSFSWQQAGAFIYTGANVDYARLAKASASGIRWVAPVIYNDSTAGPYNLGNLEALKVQAHSLNMNVAGWFNGAGGDPELDAANIAGITEAHGLTAIILDLEAPYQAPEGRAELMPQLLRYLRARFPVGTKAIAVTTNGLNDAMIWNGRCGPAATASDRSVRDLNVAVIPQWYLNGGTWADPVANMDWLQAHGMEDNFLDPGYVDKRALALAQIHGAVWADSSVPTAEQVKRLREAKAHGYGKGLVWYTLELMADADFELCKASTDLRL